MAVLDLSTLPWTVAGWRPFCWEPDKPRGYRPYVPPVPATVPGSVQKALLAAGLIPDWNYGMNSRACEWVEHRHWEMSTFIPAGSLPASERIFLDAQGLDYSGWILVDAKIVAKFSGCLVPHRIELTQWLGDGQRHELSVVFHEPPPERGQKGATSQTKYFKPRFNYSWDWCPRMVPIGVCGSIALRSGASAAFDLHRVRTELGEDNRTGSVGVTLFYDGSIVSPGDESARVEVVLRDGAREVARKSVAMAEKMDVPFSGVPVEPWWPNGEGPAKTYTLDVSAVARDGRTIWAEKKQIGFKRIEWRACEGAPKDAEPWICVVNGKPVFLQGVNWTPPTLSYHDVEEEDYRKLIDVYQDMGCNILRVWGGAGLESETFYDMCDRAGILVWQEFPLSSAGPESLPPDNDAALADLAEIIRVYVRRRNHHVSLLLWCGGNELHEGPASDPEPPCGYSFKGIALMRDVVAAEDPGRRFLPTSPSGPRFLGAAKDFGTGLLHDVHGPWTWDPADLDGCRKFWSGDDALARTEVGCGSANPADLLMHYHKAELSLPAESAFWKHQSGWWNIVEFEKFRARLPLEEAVRQFVATTQEHAAKVIEIAAWHCKRRFPRMGAFIIWMGHDCLPCLANCSVVDFHRRPKPPGVALKRVFRSRPGEGTAP